MKFGQIKQSRYFLERFFNRKGQESSRILGYSKRISSVMRNKGSKLRKLRKYLMNGAGLYENMSSANRLGSPKTPPERSFFYEMWNLNIVKNIHSMTRLKECSNCVKTLEDDGSIDDP